MKAQDNHHNQRLIRFCLEKAYPDGQITLDRLISDNLISGTQVSELAVCRTSGVNLCSVGIGRDLEDDSDIKTITIYDDHKKTFLVKNKQRTGEYNVSIRRVGKVSKIKAKIGKLRVIAYNPYQDDWRFFVIPFEDYQGLKHISIPFHKETGDPMGKYAKYQVMTWEEMCCL